MKITVKRKQLSDALSRISGSIQPKTTLPVLQNVLLEACDGTIRITGSDLEMFTRLSVEATVDKPGKTTLPLKRFMSLVSKYGTEEITIETDDTHRSSVKGGTGNIKLNGLPPDDYPEIPPVKNDFSANVPSETLFSGIDSTEFAVNVTEQRKALHGINISFEDGNIVFCGTDGKRVALLEVQAGDAAGKCAFTLPLRAAAELKRFLPSEGTVTLSHGDGRMSITYGDNVFTAKLITDNFPDVRKVIPENLASSVEVPVKGFVDVLELVAIAGEGKETDSVVLKIGNNAISVSCESTQVGEGNDTVPVEYTGKETKLMFNIHFLIDPFKKIGDKAKITFGDATPVRIENDKGFLCVLMPMRTK